MTATTLAGYRETTSLSTTRMGRMLPLASTVGRAVLALELDGMMRRLECVKVTYEVVGVV